MNESANEQEDEQYSNNGPDDYNEFEEEKK